MTAILILKALHGHLKPLIEEAGGTLEVSGAPEDTLAKLGHGPQRWRVILQWQSEAREGSTKALRGKFLIVVQQAIGLGMAKGTDIWDERAGDMALLARMHQVIRWVIAARPDHPMIDCNSWDFPEAVNFLTDPESKTAARSMMAEFSARYGIELNPRSTLTL